MFLHDCGSKVDQELKPSQQHAICRDCLTVLPGAMWAVRKQLRTRQSQRKSSAGKGFSRKWCAGPTSAARRYSASYSTIPKKLPAATQPGQMWGTRMCMRGSRS